MARPPRSWPRPTSTKRLPSAPSSTVSGGSRLLGGRLDPPRRPSPLFASLRYLPARRVLPALAVPLAAIALLADAQAAPARLFVSAEDGNEVVVLEADQVVGRIPVGKRPRG